VKITGAMHYLVALYGALGCSHSAKRKGREWTGKLSAYVSSEPKSLSFIDIQAWTLSTTMQHGFYSCS
jgi:hypothetical protein